MKSGVARAELPPCSYTVDGKDWQKYAHWDPFKYTRNLVSDGNGKYNLLILCWPMGKASPIHDHANSHCFVKMLDGRLDATNYQAPATIEVAKSVSLNCIISRINRLASPLSRRARLFYCRTT